MLLHPTYLTLLGVPSPIKSLPWLIWLKVLCIPARLMVSGQPALARETSSVSWSHRCFNPIGRIQPGVDAPSREQNAEGKTRDGLASG